VGFVGNSEHEDDPNYVLIGIVGQIQTKVSGDIQGGDPLTYSSTPGVAVKASKAGQILGRAVANATNGKVEAYISQSWYDPDVSLTDTGNFNIQNSGTQSDPVFSLVDKSNGNSLVQRIGVFAKVIAGEVTGGLFKAQKIETNSITATSAAFLAANIKTLSVDNASVSGTLTADKIVANSIELPSSAWVDALASGGLSALAQNFESSTSAALAYNALDNKIASISAQVQQVVDTLQSVNFVGFSTGSADLAMVDNLMVPGTTTLADAAISNTLSVGQNLTLASNSINTTGAPLEIQPLGQEDIDFMAGKITFDTVGNIKVSGNLEVAGDVTVKGVLSAKDVAVGRALNPQILSNTEIIATGSSALVTLKANQTELKVNDLSVKQGSLIFLTPVTEVDQPLYIKQQQNGSFIVGIKNSQTVDTKFNFIIVN
jgi:hypothetical protein